MVASDTTTDQWAGVEAVVHRRQVYRSRALVVSAQMAVLEPCIAELTTAVAVAVRAVAHTIRHIQMWAERAAWVVVETAA